MRVLLSSSDASSAVLGTRPDMQLLSSRTALATPLPSRRTALGAGRGRHAVSPQCLAQPQPLRRFGAGGAPLKQLEGVGGVGLGPLRGGRHGHGVRDVAAQAARTDVVIPDNDFKETSRKFMRHVFDPDRWEKHRSTNRYARHFWSLPTSRLLLGLAPPLVYVLAISTGFCVYEAALTAGSLPEFMPDLQIKNKDMFALTSFALSLLLAYRTNAGYERWDGARKMWGLVLNRSRDIVKEGLAWFPNDKPELKEMLVRWTAAFSKSLMCHLRKGEDIRKELEPILLPHEVEAVIKSTHRPNYVLQVLAQIIKDSGIPTAPTIEMEINLTAFEDCLGGCERILRTPIPLYYTRHTSRFMMIWLTLLPFTLYESAGWGTIPLAGVIAFLLLGVEEIGVAIEEPFTILALEAISGTALTNVRELQATHLRKQAEAAEGTGDSVSATRLVALAEGVDASARAVVAEAEVKAAMGRAAAAAAPRAPPAAAAAAAAAASAAVNASVNAMVAAAEVSSSMAAAASANGSVAGVDANGAAASANGSSSKAEQMAAAVAAAEAGVEVPPVPSKDILGRVWGVLQIPE